MKTARRNIASSALLLCAVVPTLHAATGREWRFEVFLDDKPIGFHEFRLSDAGEARELHSEARLRVKFLGLTVYDYAHRSEELWRDGCLQRIDARTDDNGEDSHVRGDVSNGRLQMKNATGAAGLPGCVMTFAYWNPAILQQQRLLNSQTGEYVDVSVQPLGESSPPQSGDPPAAHYRIRSADVAIDLWYSADHDWLALSSITPEGYRLQYRRIGEEGSAR
jgi:Domain of unknown function (DUF6134)